MPVSPLGVWPLIALGAGAYLAFALITLPASIVLSRLDSSNIHAAGVSGTVWNGRAQVLQAGGFHLGAAQWKLHVLPLFAGRLNADVKLTRTDGFAQGEVTVAAGNRVHLEDLTASLPLAALPPGIVRGAWAGTLNMKLAQLTLEEGWPIDAAGTIDLVDLTGPAGKPNGKPVDLGNYQLTFPAEAASSDALTGALKDTGGPLQLSGTLQLKPDRSYLVRGNVTARPGAPRDLADALQFLPPPESDGLRRLVEGTM
jgi:general secretion pathway protein N